MLKEGKLGIPGNKCEGHNELDLPKILKLRTVLMGFREHTKTQVALLFVTAQTCVFLAAKDWFFETNARLL